MDEPDATMDAEACREVDARLQGLEAMPVGRLTGALVSVACDRAVDDGPEAVIAFSAYLKVMADLVLVASEVRRQTGVTPRSSGPARTH